MTENKKYVVSGIYHSKTPWHDQIVVDEFTGSTKYLRGEEVVMETEWEKGVQTLRILRGDESWESHSLTSDSWIYEEHKHFAYLIEAETEDAAFQQVRERLHWDIQEYTIIPCGETNKTN